jgi:uncharacterized membrane protein
MFLPSAILTAWWSALAALALAALLAVAAWRAPWRRLLESEQSHVWLGFIVCAAILWLIGGSVGASVRFHLLAAPLAYLLFGPWLALIALAAAGAAVTWMSGDWASYPLHVLLSAALPIAVNHLVLTLCEKRLPPNYFVYIFVGAFLGGALSMFVAGLATAGIAALAAPSVRYAGEDLLAMLVMLAFGEGTLTGMLASLMVVYRPRWVGTFDDARYLGRRP